MLLDGLSQFRLPFWLSFGSLGPVQVLLISEASRLPDRLSVGLDCECVLIWSFIRISSFFAVLRRSC